MDPERAAARPADLPLADELSAVFARMAGLLLSEETVETALGLVVSLALETVPGGTGAGVTVVDERGRRTTAATDPLVRRADALQYELDEGPCLAAYAGRALVRVDDVAGDRRFPRWAASARELGLRSALSAPLVAGDRALGAMKVYGAEPGAFTPRAAELLALFAAQAAVLVANVQTHERAQRLSAALRAAVRARDVVNTARGVVVAREGVDEDAAMALLVGRSREEGVPLEEVARSVVRSAVRRRR